MAFNLRRFPRSATDETVSIQLPTPSTTIGFGWPREGDILKTCLEHWNGEDATWVNLEECLIIRRSSHANGETNINEVQSWASHDVGPTSPKPTSPTKRLGSWILRGYCGAGEFVVPAHFTLRPKAQAEETYSQGHIMKAQKGPRIWPRTILCSTSHRTPKRKDELSAGANQVKKLPIQQWSMLRLTGPCLLPCYSAFTTTPGMGW